MRGRSRLFSLAPQPPPHRGEHPRPCPRGPSLPGARLPSSNFCPRSPQLPLWDPRASALLPVIQTAFLFSLVMSSMLLKVFAPQTSR